MTTIKSEKDVVSLTTLAELMWLLGQVISFAGNLPEDSTDDLREKLELLALPARQTIRLLEKQSIVPHEPSIVDRDQLAGSVERAVDEVLREQLPELLQAQLLQAAHGLRLAQAEPLCDRDRKMSKRETDVTAREAEVSRREELVAEAEARPAPKPIEAVVEPPSNEDYDAIFSLVSEIEEQLRKDKRAVEQRRLEMEAWFERARTAHAVGKEIAPMPKVEDRKVLPQFSDGLTFDECTALVRELREGAVTFNGIEKHLKDLAKQVATQQAGLSKQSGITWERLIKLVEGSQNQKHLIGRLAKNIMANRRKATG